MSEQSEQAMAALGYLPRGKAGAKVAAGRAARYDALFSMVTEDKEENNTDVKKSLDGMTAKFMVPSIVPDMTKRLKIGDKFPGHYDTIDTGIEYNLHAAAALTGAGDQLGDSARGIKQILTEQGIVDKDSILNIEAETQDANENILRKLYADPTYGKAAISGAVAGALAEPIGLLLPMTRTKHLGKAFTYSALVGGMYGSSLYVDGDESRMKNAAFGLLAGGVFGTAIARFTRQAIGSKMDDLITNAEPKPHYRYHGKDAKTGKPKFKQVIRENKPAEVMADLEARAAMDGGRLSTLGKAKDLLDQAIQPIYDKVKAHAPKVAARMRKMDFDQHRLTRKWTQESKGFNDWFNTLPNEAQARMHSLLSTGITKETLKFAHQMGGMQGVRHLQNIKRTMKEVLGQYKSVGYKIQERADYFPTSVRDLEGLSKQYTTQLDKMFAKETKRLGRPLTKAEEKHATERLLTFDVRFSNTSGSLKKRTIEKVRDEQLPYYHDPITALHYYISTAAEDISKRKFFKDFGYVPKNKKGLDVTGADMLESVDSVAQAIKREGSTLQAQDDIVKLLRSRMDSRIHNTHAGIQALKNASYASTLGNFWSAITQLGDTIFAIHKYGIAASVKSMLGKNITTKEAMGIDKAMIELNAARSTTSKIADWAFKWGGFDALDRFGKNVNLNASLRYNKKLALKNPEKFKQKWGVHFGDEIDNVIDDLANVKMLKNEELSDNIGLMLWNDLADTQPIGLSEMPKKYLDMPNGRVVYAYKTFSLKQFNYMRTLLQKEQNPAVKAANLAYFATLFVIANTGIDAMKDFKDFIDGKDLKIDDKVLDNTLALIGTSKYAADKSKGMGGIIKQLLTPVPVEQALDVIGSVTSGDTTIGDAINTLPIVGKINREFEVVK